MARTDSASTLNKGLWPLLVVTFRGSPEDADWERMFASYEECHARAAPFTR